LLVYPCHLLCKGQVFQNVWRSYYWTLPFHYLLLQRLLVEVGFPLVSHSDH
jgi:hypothetical protein